MTEVTFDGDLSGLSERHLEFLRSILEERGFKNERVKVSAVGKAEDNFVSNVKRFVTEKDGESFKMVVKVAPTNELIRAKMPTTVVFENEHIMYTKVFPKFSKLEERANVPESERLRYPICYGSLCEKPDEIIALEDLQPLNFVMLNKQKPLTDDTVKLILKNFARLHSLSYVLNIQEPDTYEAIKNELVNYWAIITKVEQFKMLISQVENDYVAILDNEQHKNIVRGLMTKLSDYAEENGDFVKESKFGAIQHGDSWTNNILFQLEDGKTAECCMLDYQVANHTSPAADIEFMIFVSTDYETRSKHYYEWIDYYYTQLHNCLTNFGLSVDVIYPRAQFDDDLKRWAKFSLALSLFFSSMLMRESDELANMKASLQSEDDNMDEMISASTTASMSETSLKRIKTKVRGLVASFIELGYM